MTNHKTSCSLPYHLANYTIKQCGRERRKVLMFNTDHLPVKQNSIFSSLGKMVCNMMLTRNCGLAMFHEPPVD
jgi:hypothetical protein